MYFGNFGGQFSAETLMQPLHELDAAFEAHCQSIEFLSEFWDVGKTFVGRPTPLTYLENLSERQGGARIYAKREDLCHTGAHKINNALGQALLAKKMGKKRIIAETGAGQHGVATATVCARLGLDCTVYMGAKDAKRQAPNVKRMKLLGAKVHLVKTGQMTLKDAINEAMRDWITNIDTTHYLVGSAIGPHPFPSIVKHFQKIIGEEARKQILAIEKSLPAKVIACVGGGSNAIGLFTAFVASPEVELIGVQAGGKGSKDILGSADSKGSRNPESSAPLISGTPGILHGTKTMLLQDDDGMLIATHSIAPGLDYPAVGPEHAHLLQSGRASYEAVSDDEALDAFKRLTLEEGIIPALESAHAVASALKHAKQLSGEQSIIFNLSGRGDKDLDSAIEALTARGEQWD